MTADFGLANLSANIGVSQYWLVLILVWSLIWKGLALWKSARKSHLVWFIVILVINTVGILEILYIFLFSKIDLETGKIEGKTKKRKKKSKKKKSKKKKSKKKKSKK